MGIALEANHVIAAHCLLAPCIASWAGRGVNFDVILRCFLLGRELVCSAGEASEKLAVPTCFADFTKGKGTIFTDRQAFRWRWKDVFGGIFIISERLGGDARIVRFRINVRIRRLVGYGVGLLGTCRSLTPLPRTINGRAVGLKLLLASQLHIPLHGVFAERDLEQLAWVKASVFFSPSLSLAIRIIP